MLSTSITPALLVLLRLSLLVAGAPKQQPPVNYIRFKTEPTFRQVPFYVNHITNDTSLLQSGYLFVSPTHPRPQPSISYGPQIIDIHGNLVWHGLDLVDSVSSHTTVCRYLTPKEDSICFFDASDPRPAYSIGKVKILDNTYTSVGPSYGGHGALRDPDHHEMQTPAVSEGKSLLSTVFQIRPADLSDYGGPDEGYVLDGCFEEIDLETHTVTFEWCSMDHVPVWDTEVFIEQSSNYSTPVGGNGSFDRPWDFFHINAVDKNEDGDYLVSARHFNAVLKVAGANSTQRPGSIVWILGGKYSNFTTNFEFARQHMVRFQGSNSTHTSISLFDNSYDGHMQLADQSSGKVVIANTETMQAELVQELRLPAPDGQLSDSQGSVQRLPNGNTLVGWGYLQYITEYDPQGDLLYYANFSGSHIEVFRSYKFDWVGKPKTRPKLVAYTQSCEDEAYMYMYVSWNGATEVDHYRFFTSDLSSYGPWTQIANTDKDRFEDMTFAMTPFKAYAYVSAHDASGTLLSTSEAVQVFVPNANMSAGCDTQGCVQPEFFDYDIQYSAWDECRLLNKPPVNSFSALYLLIAIAICGITYRYRDKIKAQVGRIAASTGLSKGYKPVPTTTEP